MSEETALFSTNLKVIQTRFPELAKRILSSPPDPRFSVTSSKKGLPIPLFETKALLSQYAPKEQLAKLVEMQWKKEAKSPFVDTTTFVATHFAFGYLPLAIIDFIKSQLTPQMGFPPLFIIEKDLYQLRLAAQNLDISPIFEYPNLIFLPEVSTHTVVQMLSLHGTPQIAQFSLESFNQLNLDYTNALQIELNRYKEFWQVNLNTHAQFGRLWNSHIFKSISRLKEGLSPVKKASSLFDTAKGVPALVVAAGPSLNEFLPEIKAFCGRGILIAVDTAASFLQEHEIIPDFLVVSDAQYWNSLHLSHIDLSQISVVTELTVHPSLFSKKAKEFYLYASKIPIYRAIESLLEPLGNIGTGGSVATTAWDLARLMGASRICTVGLDLAFTQKQTHCAPSRFEEKCHSQSSKTLPLDNYNCQILLNNQLIPFSNGKTDQRMQIYASWFDSQIARFPGEYHRLGDKGYPIQGITEISKKDFNDLYCQGKWLKSALEWHEISFPTNTAENAKKAFTEAIEALRAVSFCPTGELLHNNPFIATLFLEANPEFLETEAKERCNLFNEKKMQIYKDFT